LNDINAFIRPVFVAVISSKELNVKWNAAESAWS